MSLCLQGWNIDLLQVDVGPFCAEHIIASSGPVLLQGGSISRAVIQRGACPQRPTFCFPAQPDWHWRFRGRETSAAEVTLSRAGDELSVRTDAGFPICSLSIDEAHFRDVARDVGLERTMDDAMHMRWTRPADPAMKSLRKAWHQFPQGPGGAAPEFGPHHRNRGPDTDVVRILLRALATGAESAEAEKVRAMDRIIRGVDSALDGRPRHAFSIRELCDTVGVTERTLRRAVQAWYGVPPKTIVRARRLHGVRRKLRAARPGRVRVTGVALEWGFEHLGRFAGDYRELFGETPSQTLARVEVKT